jgi:hypothetical protein
VNPRPKLFEMLFLIFHLILIVAVGSFSPAGFCRSFGRHFPGMHVTAVDSSLGAFGSSPPHSSSRPLYDGTNYTFPDTTTPAGISELLEVSFVKACMQLPLGYVDIMKMFIAASIAAYESNFALSRIQQELEACPRQTANRPLLPEEKKLRFQWLCMVYLTLVLMNHPSKATAGANTTYTENILADISAQLRDDYEKVIITILQAYQLERPIPSVESLKSSSFDSLSDLDKAIFSQSLRVAILTPVVVQESMAATGKNNPLSSNVRPPKPPIKVDFE